MFAVLALPSGLAFVLVAPLSFTQIQKKKRMVFPFIVFSFFFFWLWDSCYLPRQTVCLTEWNKILHRLICDHLSHITLTFAALKTHTRHTGNRSNNNNSSSSSKYVMKRTPHINILLTISTNWRNEEWWWTKKPADPKIKTSMKLIRKRQNKLEWAK